MQLLYGAFVLIFMGMGVYNLVEEQPSFAIHTFVIALYFFVLLFEFRGRPFSQGIYILMALLLLVNSMLQFFYPQGSVISGLVSLFFAYFAVQARRRINHNQ